MKRNTIIGITFLAYIVAMIGMFIGVEQYIKSKDNRLRKEIHEKIDSIFSERAQYVDISYSGYKVGFEKISLPTKPNPLGIQDEESKKLLGDMDKRRLKEWNENYGNLTKMYRTFYKGSDWDSPLDYEDGWNLVVLKHDYDGVYQKWIFPYAVGYFKQEYYFGDAYLPSVSTAVNEAFDFFTSNNKSMFYETFEKGCFDRVWSQIYAATNDYYHMEEDKNPRMHQVGSPLFEKHSADNQYHAYQNGCMYNGFYKVFIASTQPKTWTIKKYDWNPDEAEKTKLMKYWAIGLSILLLAIIVPIWIIELRHKKVKEESLYEKLKRLCNPANFIKGENYNKESVDKANAIYKRLMEINKDDEDALNEIQNQAVVDLGVSLIDEEKLSELKEKVNPKNYLTPYNAEKVALANELFALLSKDGLTYNEFIEVEQKSKEL